jgi:hypothetical protein
LFVRQFKQSGQTPLAFSKSVRHQQQNLRGVAQAVSIAWYLTLATIVTATSSASHEVWPTRRVCLPGGVQVELKAVFEQASMVSFLQELAQCKLN